MGGAEPEIISYDHMFSIGKTGDPAFQIFPIRIQRGR